MYGFVNFALEQLVIRNFGEDIWAKIKKEAGVEIEGNFMIRVIYSDDLTYNLVHAACKILNLPATAILEKFGQFFFEFCVESGYDKILSVLGSSTKDFLQNLDALHDHLSTIYPGMKAPSFRCTENQDGTFILHYYSDRPGLEFIVIGLVKTVSFQLHKSEVECKLFKSKGEDDCDHVQFLIIEKVQENKEKNLELNEIKIKLQKYLKPNNDIKMPMISQKTFCKVFPFHIIFDRNMIVRQYGTSISRFIPQIKNKDCKITSIFNIVRPHINLEFAAIRAHVMSVFVFTNKTGVVSVARKNELYSSSSLEETSTRFKGQMVYLDDKDLMLFQCSPCIMSVDDLFKHGLYISDIPMHDSNRELMLINEHWSEEFVLTQNLEILTDKLQQATKELESEKQKTDELLYECLPPSIAQQLRQDRPVVPARYEMISLMFCGIKDFNLYCMKHSNNSQQIVNLLNTVFTVLDQKVHKYPEVYKVETVGDKYMAVCGLPEKVDNNTLYICRLALDIIEASSSEISKLIKEEVVLTIGINSGPVVTGVIGKRMPRYCLFGDTVNLTSRCETTGIKGKINVSEFAYENLQNANFNDPSFVFDFRGEVVMKGKPRPIKMWLLSRKITEVKCPFSSMNEIIL